MMGFMYCPDRGQIGQHQAVEHAAAGCQQACDKVFLSIVFTALLTQSMVAGKLVADFQPGHAGHLRPQQSLHRFAPDLALIQAPLVQLQVIGAGADDAKTTQAVSQGQRQGPGHKGMGAQSLEGRQRDIAGRGIEVEHPRQHDLHRAALGTDHQVNTAQIASDPGVDLFADQQDKSHRCQPQAQQQQVQTCRQWLGP